MENYPANPGADFEKMEGAATSKQFGGVLLDWRIIDCSEAVDSAYIRIGDQNALARLAMGVIIQDPQSRFADFRPIITTNLTGFDLQFMRINTLNSAYSLAGLGVWLKISHPNYRAVIEKQRKIVSKIAREYRERTRL